MRVVYGKRALRDLERLIEFQENRILAERAIALITGAIEMLSQHPYIGRPVRNSLRELVISYGRTGYVALYRVVSTRVEVLALRHPKEVGYR